MSKTIRGILLFTLISTLLFGGCSQNNRLSKRSIVYAIMLENGENITLTVEYLADNRNPDEQKFKLLTGHGATLEEALATIENQSGKSLYLSSCKIILLHNSSADPCFIQKSIELFEENGAIGLLTPLAVTDASSKEIFIAEGSGIPSGKRIYELLESQRLKSATLQSALSAFATQSGSVLLPVIGVDEDEYRIHSYLTTRTGERWNASLSKQIPFLGDDAASLTLTSADGIRYDLLLTRNQAFPHLQLQENRLQVEWQLQLKAELIGCSNRFLDDAAIQAQMLLKKTAAAEYSALFERLFKIDGQDLFGLEQKFSFFFPEIPNQSPDSWRQYLKNMDNTVMVNVSVLDSREFTG